MVVTFICKNDWANIAYILTECLKKIGVECYAFKTNKHHYNYPAQAPIFSKANQIRPYVEKSDVIIFIHSEYIETGVNLKNKKVYVMHTGSRYRQNSAAINKVFNPIVNATLNGGDMLGMGAKNEIWIQPPIDTINIQPVFKKNDGKKLIIGHYPSGKFKGTEKIVNVISKLKNRNFEFVYDLNTVPWNKQIERMSKCDIYIENMMEFQGDVPLKIFGMTSLETSCLGKIPIMRFPVVKEYEKLFGKCGIQVTNNLEELENKLEWLLTLSYDEILNLQKQARKWVEDCHSYEVIGKFYKKIFEG